MRRDDWFETLAFAHEGASQRRDGEARKRFLAVLASVERMLGDATGRRDFGRISGLGGFHMATRLSASERKRAEQLCERVWQTTGAGRTYAEEALLGQVGAQASPDSLPFFRAALETSRERDSFQARRRRMAVASVAFIAHQQGDAAASAQLEAWLTHSDVTVRTEATALYGRLHFREEGGLDVSARSALERVAYKDRAFAPRFLARGWLHAAGVAVPVEPPEGVYAFQASLGRVSRTVELTASQGLDELVDAILGAFGWDHDHLYEFALTGDLRDGRFILPDREEEALGFDWSFDTDAEQGDAESDELPAPPGRPSPMSLPLGAFGLPKGHEFIFRYDFGDDHRFRVKVRDIHAHRSPRTKYPRVVDSTGKAPEQYPRFG
ncbi:plasmid pRiA4b ORF-3 family protein [Hyalangium gracile]|uniref:plasmid pRiA4b ORF-3 family protein n=1 Tax=Hyalangium gracile TaxID=394092 RepID=UPI001CC9C270|nr:plasmid pRiA4b ORF-3 family protein [Hyalangium gracile]